jgi:hypothetical protein
MIRKTHLAILQSEIHREHGLYDVSFTKNVVSNVLFRRAAFALAVI